MCAFWRRRRIFLPQPRFRAPHPHRAEVADGERPVGLGPGDRAQRRRADRAAGAEQELALPALPRGVAGDGAVGTDGQRLRIGVPGHGAGRGGDRSERGARGHGPARQPLGHWAAGDLHRPFQPAVARRVEGAAGGIVGAGAGHPLEGRAFEAEVGAHVGRVFAPGPQRVGDDPRAEAGAVEGEAAVAGEAPEARARADGCTPLPRRPLWASHQLAVTLAWAMS